MTDSELIDKLGGTVAVALLFGVKPPSVSQWRADGIPRARRRHLQDIRPDLFASDCPDAAEAKTADTQARAA